MASADLNDLLAAQEKLEWVTPKISLMDAGDTSGGKPFSGGERILGVHPHYYVSAKGPS